jgi:hypothetical protein
MPLLVQPVLLVGADGAAAQQAGGGGGGGGGNESAGGEKGEKEKAGGGEQSQSLAKAMAQLSAGLPRIELPCAVHALQATLQAFVYARRIEPLGGVRPAGLRARGGG